MVHALTTTHENALQMLIDGNQRYINDMAEHPHQSAERRAEVLPSQHPFAIILSCADSRVPPEVFFDQGIGDLFIIRNAGNILDDVVIGSIEYGVEHLGVPLIVVLGHTKCGAVTATVHGNGQAPGHICSIVETITPAVEATRGLAGDPVWNATMANIRLSVHKLKHCGPFISEFVQRGHVKVVGAIYHLDSGMVEFLK